MKTVGQVYGALRRKNIQNYLLLAVCSFISVLLITSFSIIMQSHTVQTMLPEGGDSRKLMMMIFTLAIVGCGVFTGYASTLFFRSKSREMGIYMALGVNKKSLSALLLTDVALISAISTLLGMVLGFPLAAGIWQLFRLLVVDSQDMIFQADFLGFLWPLTFSVFSILMLLVMSIRFIRRSNIVDVINEQRKSEPIRDVKPWYGIAGVVLMIVGAGTPTVVPMLLASFGYTTPVWANLLFLLAGAGLYLLLIFIVVRGFGGKKSYYKNIITRSMMKFQGRQTVLNMCVITVLLMAAYFAMFYTPMLLVPNLVGIANRPIDNAFHYRADESNIPTREEIAQLATEENVILKDYSETPFVNLATDGYDREWIEGGRFGNEYHSFYNEESFLSESAFRAISGIDVAVPTGEYMHISRSGYINSPYDYFEEMMLFTNPTTSQTLSVSFYDEVHYDMLHGYMVLNDADYAAITNGLGIEWQENWVQFNVEQVGETYTFANRLRDAIIDGSGAQSAVYENYDHIERMNAHAAGLDYRGDTEADLQVDYKEKNSSKFSQYWKYTPQFRILDQQNIVLNMCVFLMLYVFMAIICIAAVIVIAYTRCLTIATTNRQVYDDLRHLGAKREYLFRSVKGQVARVFLFPIAIGTVGVLVFFLLLMFTNDGVIAADEWLIMSINVGLVAGTSLVLWGVYRMTLGKVCQMLGVAGK